MGAMVGGTYHIGDDVTQTLQSGEWERSKSTVRHWITVDGAPGLTGDGGFKAEHGRYHLFVAWNCPWAHRTLVTRALKGLEEAISVSYARPNRTDQGGFLMKQDRSLTLCWACKRFMRSTVVIPWITPAASRSQSSGTSAKIAWSATNLPTLCACLD